MKVLHIADIHLQGGLDSEEGQALMKVVDVSQDHNVDLVVVAGDVFEAKSTPEQRLVFKHFLALIRNTGAKVVIIRGNHDEAGDLKIYDDPDSGIWVFEQPGVEQIPVGGEEVQILTIPHFNAGAIALQESTLAGYNETGTSAFDAILDDYFQRVHDFDGISVAVVHATISGAQLDNGMIPRENGIHLNVDRLSALSCLVCAGHYHKRQELAPMVHYSGSITRQTYGETDDKGVNIYTFRGPLLVDTEFISLNPTPRITIEAEWRDNDFYLLNDVTNSTVLSSFYDFSGAFVKFRYTVNQSDLPLIDLAPIRKFFDLAKELKIEQIVNITTAIRNEAVLHVDSVEDLFAVWAEAKGEPRERITQALALLSELDPDKLGTAPDQSDPASEGVGVSDAGHTPIPPLQLDNSEVFVNV